MEFRGAVLGVLPRAVPPGLRGLPEPLELLAPLELAPLELLVAAVLVPAVPPPTQAVASKEIADRATSWFVLTSLFILRRKDSRMTYSKLARGTGPTRMHLSLTGLGGNADSRV